MEYYSASRKKAILPFVTTGACMHAKSLQSCLTLCDPMTAAHQYKYKWTHAVQTHIV